MTPTQPFAEAEGALLKPGLHRHTHKPRGREFVRVEAKPLICVRTGQMKMNTCTTKDGLTKHLISKKLGCEPVKADKKQILEVA